MSRAHHSVVRTERLIDWSGLMHELGPRFAERASICDASDAFVANNFAELKERGVLAAGVPRKLGGGGASYAELCGMLRTLARYCGSTALVLSMHTHVVATMVWRWHHTPEPLNGLLCRIVSQKFHLATSGASDWLTPSGMAKRVEGGWRITGRKIFASGIPVADLFLTQAIYDDPKDGPVVLVFIVPAKQQGVAPQDNWRALGMRGTGSHDVAIERAFVPDSAILLRRPAGKWSPPFHLNPGMVPLPLVYAVYLGLAEIARDTALVVARKRLHDPGLAYLVGEMENNLALARVVHRDMVQAVETGVPGMEITNRIWIGRTLVGRAAISVVEKAMEVAGGSSFFRTSGIERLFRDVQGARFHRPQERAQLRFSGRYALGMAVDE
jgi:alkylation response protein AidB-like acyl-CoA dehydrogenase